MAPTTAASVSARADDSECDRRLKDAMSAATSRLDARADGRRVATWTSAISAISRDRRSMGALTDRARRKLASRHSPRLATTIPTSFGSAAWVRPRTFCVTESIA